LVGPRDARGNSRPGGATASSQRATAPGTRANAARSRGGRSRPPKPGAHARWLLTAAPPGLMDGRVTGVPGIGPAPGMRGSRMAFRRPETRGVPPLANATRGFSKCVLNFNFNPTADANLRYLRRGPGITLDPKNQHIALAGDSSRLTIRPLVPSGRAAEVRAGESARESPTPPGRFGRSSSRPRPR